jgi:hypothetical protein
MRRCSRLESWLLVERLEQPHVGEILGTPGGALHLQLVVAVGDRGREQTSSQLGGGGVPAQREL